MKRICWINKKTIKSEIMFYIVFYPSRQEEGRFWYLHQLLNKKRS